MITARADDQETGEATHFGRIGLQPIAWLVSLETMRRYFRLAVVPGRTVPHRLRHFLGRARCAI
jgi:hypothetical protein